MLHEDDIRSLRDDPEAMEQAYQDALRAGDAKAFEEAVDASYAEATDDPLLAAWHYRLAYAAAVASERLIAWEWALPLALINGALLWLLSDDTQFALQVTNPLTGSSHQIMPLVLLLAAPVSAIVAMVFLEGAGKRRWSHVAAIAIGIAALTLYVVGVYPRLGPEVYQEQYLALMTAHLAAASWFGVGWLLTGRDAGDQDRFGYLAKSLDLAVVGGLFAVVGGLFVAMTFALFSALGVDMPLVVSRLFVAGGAGAIGMIALAVVYDPGVSPSEQEFEVGFSKLVSTLMRLLLPLSAIVLLVYLAFIPFNFREPFENREVLITFNAMLFAVVALIVGATPVHGRRVGSEIQIWLRRAVMMLAALAVLVGLYALAAIAYRTAIDRLTPNRLDFIGWNIINIGLLAWLAVSLVRRDTADWLDAVHGTYSRWIAPYAAWTVLMILALPWLFGIDQGDVSQLPNSVQEIVYEQPYPVLLKCTGSPHIYLLDEGEKRWIEDIPTFDSRGYQWADVRFVPCEDLASVPDGTPIPEDAGVPPVPVDLTD
ncbi:MAG: hypothetical protein ACK2UL_05985 [Anaerolineae bacterium]